MKFQFTKYSFINALWSLIPIFPTWTIFPGVLMAIGIEQLTGDCEGSYSIVLWISIIAAMILGFLYSNRLEQTLKKKNKEIKRTFRIWSLGIYTFINTAGLILFVGTDLACNGDGQTFLAVIFTGPIASAFLIVYGLFLDIKIKLKGANKT
jgi:putative Mn2+ efflux pump MntP